MSYLCRYALVSTGFKGFFLLNFNMGKKLFNTQFGYFWVLLLPFFSLGPLVCKVKDHQVEVIVDTLCNNMIGDKEQLRDISSIGLKTVINELPLTTQTLAATVCKTIVGRLSSAISQQEDVGVQLEALDILGKIVFKNCRNYRLYFVRLIHSVIN